ncbi:MAG: hypothetical protein JW909_04005 [Planctomycetes bacterium]|nr:hypothetical protein [Planctomycetota bacterium]
MKPPAPQHPHPNVRKPRTGIVAVDDGLYTHRWAAAVMDDPSIDVVFVACISPFTARNFNPGGARGPLAGSFSRLRYYGLADTAVFAAKWFVETLRCIVSPGDNSLGEAARRRSIPVFSPPDGDVNDQRFISTVGRYEPDLLVCAFSQIAGPGFLAVPGIGCLNVHFSLLPQNRGREPLFHAMLSGGDTGVSVHWMTKGVDDGALVFARRVPSAGIHTLHALIMRAAAEARIVVPWAVTAAMNWCGSRTASGPLPKRNRWPSPKDVARFRGKGFRFV